MPKERTPNPAILDDDEEDDSKIFPQRLMEILSDESNHEAICWLPHGRAFIVRKRDLFAEKVMPKYFSRKAKYSSFTRKLNRWNFVRVSSGPELGAYYHEFFLRDRPQLAAQMFCKNARTMLAMATSSDEGLVPTTSTNNTSANASPPTAAMIMASKGTSLSEPAPMALTATPEPLSRVAPSVLSNFQHMSLRENAATCNNMASMNSSTATATGQSSALINPASLSVQGTPSPIPVTPALLAALTKDPTPGQSNKMAGYAATNIRLLEMHILQQEQANRILYEHAMKLSLLQRQEQQTKLIQEQARLQQMRQLLQLRHQQRARDNPTSNRASAA